MKISTRARYGLRGLFDIAYHNLGRPTHVKDTARRQGVTPRYLEQIFQALKREGIVAAQRGPKGGYFLARAPESITIGDVVRATEGPIRFSCDGSGKGGKAATGTRRVRAAPGNGSATSGARAAATSGARAAAPSGARAAATPGARAAATPGAGTATTLGVGASATPGAGPGGADGHAEITGAVWDELAARVEGLLDDITLADLCARGEAEGLPREADARRIMYFI
jgi:Rrf2 family protein